MCGCSFTKIKTVGHHTLKVHRRARQDDCVSYGKCFHKLDAFKQHKRSIQVENNPSMRFNETVEGNKSLISLPWNKRSPSKYHFSCSCCVELFKEPDYLKDHQTCTHVSRECYNLIEKCYNGHNDTEDTDNKPIETLSSEEQLNTKHLVEGHYDNIQHVDNKMEYNRILCNPCDHQERWERRVWYLKLSVHGRVIIMCDECEHSKNQHATLTRHNPCDCGRLTVGKTVISPITEGKKPKLDDAFKCLGEQCNYAATESNLLRQHQSLIQMEKLEVKCLSKKFQNARFSKWIYIECTLNSPKISSHKGTGYTCKKCEHHATQRLPLQRHGQCIHDGIECKCKECEYHTKQKWHLREHEQREQEGTIYNCDLDGEREKGNLFLWNYFLFFFFWKYFLCLGLSTIRIYWIENKNTHIGQPCKFV